jgi:hypothetical protein
MQLEPPRLASPASGGGLLRMIWTRWDVIWVTPVCVQDD